MGQLSTKIGKRTVKAFHEIPPPKVVDSPIIRREVSSEELNIFQTEEVELVSKVKKLMFDRPIEENPNFEKQIGVIVEPTLQEKIDVVKMMDPTFDEERYLLSREVKAANLANSLDKDPMSLNMHYLKSIKYKKKVVVNGMKLHEIMNQYNKLIEQQLPSQEIIAGLSTRHNVPEQTLTAMLKYFDTPAWTYDKKIIDMKIAYDREGEVPY
jgi:hypothetical protein